METNGLLKKSQVLWEKVAKDLSKQGKIDLAELLEVERELILREGE